MNYDPKEIIKYTALLEELETSQKSINLGFGEIQNLSLNNCFHFLPFQLLSQGFERFMKSYICLAFENINGTYPNFNYLKNLGHNLESLLEEILNNYFYKFDRPQYFEPEHHLVSQVEAINFFELIWPEALLVKRRNKQEYKNIFMIIYPYLKS